jgi:hypothetical protein
VACWNQVDRWDLGDVGTLDGGMNDQPEPAMVDGLSDAVQVAVGDRTECAMRATGQVVCWRYDKGSPDGGRQTYRGAAMPVGLSDAVQVMVSGTAVCARRRDGRVACVPCVDGAPVMTDEGEACVPGAAVAPVTVEGLAGVVQIAAAGRWGWAQDANGQVTKWWFHPGDVGPLRQVSSPFVGLAGAVQIATGPLQACALHADGTVACWGVVLGPDWKLNSCAIEEYAVPTPIAGL